MNYQAKRSMLSEMVFDGKRVEFVGVKFSAAEKRHLERIAVENDRPVSYVVRELALRGLVQYLQDRKLRMTNTETALANHLLSPPEGPGMSDIIPADLTVIRVPHGGTADLSDEPLGSRNNTQSDDSQEGGRKAS